MKCVCVCVHVRTYFGKLWEGFGHYFLKYFSDILSNPSPLFFWDSRSAYVGMHDGFPQVFEVLFSFLHSFFVVPLTASLN